MTASSKTISLSNYSIGYSDRFFFDTNVWLDLLTPGDRSQGGANEKRVKLYSSFFKEVLEKDKLILSNLIQYSELSNVMIQTEFRSWLYSKQLASNVKFKEFRTLPQHREDYRKCVKKISPFLHAFIQKVSFIDGSFSDPEIKNIISEWNDADFNDLYFAHFCIKQNCFLVTNDSDFVHLALPINIITK